MKKIISILLVVCFLTLCFASCDKNNGKQNTDTDNQTQEIVLTKDNFKNYFTIEVESDIDITKHGDKIVLGVYVPATYSAVADVDVDVFASSPIDSYNVKVTLEVKTSYVYWNKQTITLNLSSDGSASKNLTITTSDDQTIYFENDCDKKFYASIVSVEGTVKPK